jgi:hypothetical protein
MSVVSPALFSAPKKFGDPFILPSTGVFPTDVKSTFDLCLYLYRINRIYGSVANRLVSYFVTDIEFKGSEGSKSERDAFSEVLKDKLHVLSVLQQAGIEWAIYGNAFVRCVEPFSRWLIDDRDGRFKAIALSAYPEAHVTYNWQDLTYTVPDLAAYDKMKSSGKKKLNVTDLPKVTLAFRDKPETSVDKFSVTFLDPRYVTLDKPHHSSQVSYVYSVPPDMESRIKSNVLHEINNTPRGLLEAVAKAKDFRFRTGEVFHFRPPTPTGVSDSGWAVPEILWHFDSLYQLQIYRKADYAVAQDYLLPLRVFTPNFGDSVGDSVMSLLMSQWKGEMRRMTEQRRKDPTSIHVLPFKADYNEYGTSGRNMVMHDVVNAYIDALFDGMGFPRELFRGSMQVDQLPNAVRMFERQYEWLYTNLNGLLNFITKSTQRALDIREIPVKLKRPVMAYNAEWMQLKMQLAANREIPRGAVYPDIGVDDPSAAAELAALEDQDIQRRTHALSVKFEKEMTQGSMADMAMAAAEQGVQQANQGGGAGAPAGGAPSEGGGLDYAVNVADDPLQITRRAQEIATEWLRMHTAQPNSHRKEMQRAEATNPTLYAAAVQEMKKMRSSAESQGRANIGQMLG